MIYNVLIFVGGYGKRLGNLTKKTPKPLLKFNNIPFIEYLLKKIILLKPKKIIFLTKYKNNLFKKNYHNKKINNTILKCLIEKKKLGTGGSLYNALEDVILKKIINKNLAIGSIEKKIHIDIGTKKNFNHFLKYSKKIKL